MGAPCRGQFFAFEGIDGSGKSTQAHMLAEKLRHCGVHCEVTREPTDGPVGCLIRQHMSKRIHLNEETVAALFVADRIDHLMNETNGMLETVRSGKTVITDRYYFSSYAYHSVCLSLDWIIKANSISAHLLRPDLTIFLDVAPSQCLERIATSRAALQRYEEIVHLEKVRSAYMAAFDQLSAEENILIVDGSKSIEQIACDIWQAVQASRIRESGNTA